MKSKRTLILLQGAQWCIQRARILVERRVDHGWDRALSLRLDQLLTIEDLLTEIFVGERAA